MSTRRYGDDEVREIFSLATAGDAAERALPSESGGMTLVELQRIGEEAGIEPARVAQAARALELRATTAPVRRQFGMPVGLTRVVELPRAPSESEWEHLVSEFRSVFDAPGQMTTSGGFREWSNGSLHIAVEPTSQGTQLRISTLKNDALVLNVLGVLLSGMALVTSVSVTAAGKPEKALAVLAMFGGMGLAALAFNVLRLPSWKRERERQFATVAEQAVKLLSAP